jgi:DNA-binding LacI/PurR family transcriptional regulator/biotin operon repressor
MAELEILTAAAQVAAYFRGELLRGKWSGQMPGGDRLAAELGIGRDTVETALQRLEVEGLLQNQGRRRGRRIVTTPLEKLRPGIRVGILTQELADRRLDYMVELEHKLGLAGHTVIHAPSMLSGLKYDLGRIKRMVKLMEADAWVVSAGPRDVLEWFSRRDKPTMALFGRRRGLKMAGVGPDKPPVMGEITRRLVELGHRRIVLLARQPRRLPKPGSSERAFLSALAAQGITPGQYHLPDWKESVEGYHERLDLMFRLNPPTALIMDEATLFSAAQQFLAARGLRVPEDVSLICMDHCPTFDWHLPGISHVRWDSRPVVRRVVRWVDNVSRGKVDLKQTLTPAEFVEGGTTGAVRVGSDR